MSKLWTTLGLSLLMDVFTRPFVQQRLFRYWLTRNPPMAEMTATGTATTRCSVERENRTWMQVYAQTVTAGFTGAKRTNSQSSAWKRCVNDWYERGRNRSVKQSCYSGGALKPSSDPDSWNGPFLKATVGIDSIRLTSHDGGGETFGPSTSPELKVL